MITSSSFHFQLLVQFSIFTFAKIKILSENETKSIVWSRNWTLEWERAFPISNSQHWMQPLIGFKLRVAKRKLSQMFYWEWNKNSEIYDLNGNLTVSLAFYLLEMCRQTWEREKIVENAFFWLLDGVWSEIWDGWILLQNQQFASKI